MKHAPDRRRRHVPLALTVCRLPPMVPHRAQVTVHSPAAGNSDESIVRVALLDAFPVIICVVGFVTFAVVGHSGAGLVGHGGPSSVGFTPLHPLHT